MKMIKTERLILRDLSYGDAENIEELAGDYDVAKTTLTIPHPYPKGVAQEFIASMKIAESEGKVVIFSIERKEDSSFIGIININIQKNYHRGELAYWIGKPYWGKGYGTEATKAIIEYGFEKLDLNKIFATSFTNNPGSWRIMEKCGLKHEGILRQHVKRLGEYIDLTYYGLLKDEYLNTNK
ncbi:acetyltransferase [Heyndrickxia shackletonii]|uniref:Acetyltransferase n=1 Tax=Heyndrickxia shackletonii TaxID=157838 RepID=A0A0Q3TLN3_9BACI|nr:GNAT family protein [Heyndrickxia shackletonii]KQL54896.1 acetyltransferase [Heyndrickxia shackletonii]MBB2479497.1 GNAT family N-acetyltransferase [Bacillus sp. APMAM]NEY99437.1 GNAT family N-acetyltransferase [Heyndrickxia shackletonii]RTZ57345.1 N-acetyltransferase [Bacillus sp. SAJ1]